MSTLAYVALWLEHWSCKPGVESLILSGGFQFFIFIFYLKCADSTNSTTQMTITGSVAQWLEHWSTKPGVESSIISRGFSLFSSLLFKQNLLKLKDSNKHDSLYSSVVRALV